MKYSIFFILVIVALHLFSSSSANGDYGDNSASSTKPSYAESPKDDSPSNSDDEKVNQHATKQEYVNSSEKKEENVEDDGDEGDASLPRYSALPNALETLDNWLSSSHYYNSCPDAEAIILSKVEESFHNDYTIAASLIRLHFHDCAVRGCDASILLDHEGSERESNASKTLRGFDLIDEIKAEIEKKCPKTVSCADILTAASRDATRLVGGPYWPVPFGRRDGKVSYAKEADKVPMGHENMSELLEFFQSKGLNVLDLVVLSGAHTIGRTSCASVQYRLYNDKSEDSIDEKYLDFLERKCRWASDFTELDPETPWTFDNEYYQNLQKKMGTLSTDQLLNSDEKTKPLVDLFAKSRSVFHYQFGVSMIKLGNIGALTDEDEGEIRTTCSSVN
ncbi:hypothetical protein ACFE04_002669 [Oxalis oulophora]